MEKNKDKINTFKDLIVWQEGHKLVIVLYETTKTFPRDELFALTNQIRKAGISITSNIAEGFGRETYRDKHHFYQMALGSILEIQNQLLIAKYVGYIVEEKFCVIMEQARKT
ncbi:four helix bundle protein, partial [bacterium]|nr:four helix bundle protein [bacterium]